MPAFIMKSVVYIALLFWLAAARQPALFFAAYTSMLVSAMAGAGAGRRKLILPSLAVGLFILLVNVCFDLYKPAQSDHYIQAFIILIVSAAALLASFYIVLKQDAYPDGPAPARQNTARFILKLGSALILSVIAGYLLKARLELAAILVYVICLIQFVNVMPYEKAAAEKMPPAAPVSEKYVHAPDIDGVFSYLALLILLFRSYDSFMHYGLKEPLILMVTAAFLAGTAFSLKDPGLSDNKTKDGLKWLDFGIMAAFVIAAFMIRISMIELPGIIGDDLHDLRAVTKLIYGDRSIFSSEPTTLQPTMLFWIMKKFMVFTGGQLTLVTARLVSVVMGSLSVACIYLLAFELFRRRTAVISGVITIVLFIHIMYSRQVVGLIEVVPFSALAVYFYLRALRTGGILDWIASGLATGIGMYFYNPLKFVPVIIALYSLIFVLGSRDKKGAFFRVLPGFIVVACAAFAAFFPLIEYAFTNPGDFFYRIAYTSVFSNIKDLGGFVQNFVNQTALTLKVMFVDNFDYSGMFAIPGRQLMGGLEVFFLIAGAAASLFMWRRLPNALLFVWFGIGLVPAIFSGYYHSNGFRALLALPPIIIFMARGIDFLAGEAEKMFGRPGKAAAPAVISVILIFFAYRGINDYFTVYLNDPNVRTVWSTNIYKMAEHASSVRNSNVLLSSFYGGNRFISAQPLFALFKIKPGSLFVPRPSFKDIYNEEGKDVLILAEAANDKNIELLGEFFPNAAVKVFYNYNYWLYTDPGSPARKAYGWKAPDAAANHYYRMERGMVPYDLDINSKPYVSYVSCHIPYGDIKELYGFKTVFSSGGKKVAEQRTSGALNVSEIDCDAIEFEGMLDAGAYGEYEFTCEGADIDSVSVAGSAKTGRGKAVLIKGLNRAGIRLNNIRNDEIKLMWKHKSMNTARIVGFGDVIQGKSVPGLLCRTTHRTGSYTSAYYVMHHAFFFHANDGDQCDGIDREWTGNLEIKEAERYRVIFKTAFKAEVYVDGVKACVSEKNSYEAPEMQLSRGRHKIRINEKGYTCYENKSVQLLTWKHGQAMPAEVTCRQLSR